MPNSKPGFTSRFLPTGAIHSIGTASAAAGFQTTDSPITSTEPIPATSIRGQKNSLVLWFGQSSETVYLVQASEGMKSFLAFHL